MSMGKRSCHKQVNDWQQPFTCLVLRIYSVVLNNFIYKPLKILFPRLIFTKHLILWRKNSHVIILKLHFYHFIGCLKLIELSDSSYHNLIKEINFNDVFLNFTKNYLMWKYWLNNSNNFHFKLWSVLCKVFELNITKF